MNEEKVQIKETKRVDRKSNNYAEHGNVHSMQSLSVLHGSPDTKTTHNHTFFFNIDCCFGSTCIVGNLFCISMPP